MPAWHTHPSVWLVLGGVWVAYLVAVRRHRVVAGEPSDRRRRTTLFSIGMACLWLGADWPVHDLAEGYLYSVHMAQHLLFTLVAPPLLIAGMPAWMWRDILRPRWLFVAFRFLTRPVVALIVFNGLLLFTHWPEVVDASVRSELTHFTLHVLLVGSAIVMWWPVMSPLVELPALSPPAQMMYLFAQSLAPTIPASFLTFGHTLLYPVYGTFPRIWGISALNDQLIAGLEMKLGRRVHPVGVRRHDLLPVARPRGARRVGRPRVPRRGARAADEGAAMRPVLRDRLVMPILLPLGILAVIAAVLFGFSRILLSLTPTAATVTAIVVASGVVITAAVAAGRKQVRLSTLGAMLGVTAGVAMLAGGVALAVVGGSEEEAGGGEKPVVTLAAANIAFEPTSLTVPAGEAFTLQFHNQDANTQHNVQIFDDPKFAGTPLFSGALVTGVRQTDYEVDPLEAGAYFFHCEVHPTMTGEMQAVPSGGGGGGTGPSGPAAAAA